MIESDANHTSSFTNNITWSDGNYVSPTNDYATASYLLRAPAFDQNTTSSPPVSIRTFMGNSLTINQGGALLLKDTNICYVTNLILDAGGAIYVNGNGGKKLGLGQFDRLAGNITMEQGNGAGNFIFNGGTADKIWKHRGGWECLANVSGSGPMYLGANGLIELSGSNSFTAGIQMSHGRLKINSAYAIPHGVGYGDLINSTAGFVTNSGYVLMNGTIDMNGYNVTFNGFTGASSSSGNAVLFNSASNTAVTLTVGDNDASGNWGGQIGDTLGSFGFPQLSETTNIPVQPLGGGTVAFTKIGAGTEVLSGSNSYSGDTTINAGILQLGASFCAIPSGPGKGNVILNGTLDLAGNGQYINGLSGAGTVDNIANTINGNLYVGADDASSIFAGTITNTSAAVDLYKVGAGTFDFTGTAWHEGTTAIQEGTLMVDGAFNGTNAVTVDGSGTLGGTGVINGPVTVNAQGTLLVGSSIGTLTINNDLSLAGTNVMRINKSGATLTGDLIRGVNNLTYGGTLQILLTGDPLAAGDAIQLYAAANYADGFAQINPVSPGPGLSWDTSTLASDGTLRVVATPTPVIISQETFGNGAVVMEGTNGVANGTYYVLSSTNVALPLADWIPVLTNSFESNGTFSNSIPVDPTAPQAFYLIEQ